MFIPFLGALITLKQLPDDAWRRRRSRSPGRSWAGSARSRLGARRVVDSRLLVALAFAGFFLNLFNLAPSAARRRPDHLRDPPALWLAGLVVLLG